MALDGTSLRSRRALLAGTVGGLAALAAQALGRPAPTYATHGDVHLGIVNDSTSTTYIRNSSSGSSGFSASATNGGGTGVYGASQSGRGVFGRGFGAGPGVQGTSSSGYGVFGETFDESSAGVYGLGDTGYGVFGESDTGQGVKGFCTSGTGVRGESVEGRGGLFSGGKANIRLQPSSAATHPSSGQAGDIFLDASKRLWLCKGGTTWVRIV